MDNINVIVKCIGPAQNGLIPAFLHDDKIIRETSHHCASGINQGHNPCVPDVNVNVSAAPWLNEMLDGKGILIERLHKFWNQSVIGIKLNQHLKIVVTGTLLFEAIKKIGQTPVWVAFDSRSN